MAIDLGWVCKCMFGCVIVHFLSSPKFKNCELSLYCIVHFWFRENLSLPLQDVVLQWLMSETIQLNQIDAEDPEVSIYAQLCVCVWGGDIIMRTWWTDIHLLLLFSHL